MKIQITILSKQPKKKIFEQTFKTSFSHTSSNLSQSLSSLSISSQEDLSSMRTSHSPIGSSYYETPHNKGFFVDMMNSLHSVKNEQSNNAMEHNEKSNENYIVS